MLGWMIAGWEAAIGAGVIVVAVVWVLVLTPWAGHKQHPQKPKAPPVPTFEGRRWAQLHTQGLRSGARSSDTTLDDPHRKTLLTEKAFHDLMLDVRGL